MAQVTKIEAPFYTPEQAQEIVRVARRIADEEMQDDSEWAIIFEQSCRLLALKSVSFVAEQQIPFVPPQLNHKVR